jgi:hypothetical protein
MKSNLKSRTHHVLELGKQFQNQKEFRESSYTDFEFARRQGLLNKIFPKRKIYKPKDYWNNEISILKEAIKYYSKSELCSANQVCYLIANKNFPGLLDDFYGVKVNGKKLVNSIIWINRKNIFNT